HCRWSPPRRLHFASAASRLAASVSPPPPRFCRLTPRRLRLTPRRLRLTPCFCFLAFCFCLMLFLFLF
ncbi:hypothetical protein S245_060802, partial [Arachis hypogaea]